YWTKPAKDSPGYFAFKIYRNADGKGTGFGDRAARAVSSAPNEVSCFAGLDGKTGAPTAMIVSKNPLLDPVVTIHVRHSKPITRARLWRYDGSNKRAIVALPDAKIAGGTLKMKAPGYSITLARFE